MSCPAMIRSIIGGTKVGDKAIRLIWQLDTNSDGQVSITTSQTHWYTIHVYAHTQARKNNNITQANKQTSAMPSYNGNRSPHTLHNSFFAV